MQAKPMFYDGSGENKQPTGAAKTPAASVVITSEMRKSISGNPFVFVK